MRFLILILTALLSFPLVADEASSVPAGASFKDVLSLSSVRSPKIAPDGSAVVYELRSTNWEANRYDTELWLAKPGAEAFQLTRTAKGSSTNAAWSPKGRLIAFLADRGGDTQIRLIRAAGGESWALTAVDDGISGFAWSPDGSHMAVLITDPDEDGEQREESFGAFAIEDAEHSYDHLWLLDVDLALETEDGATLPEDEEESDDEDSEAAEEEEPEEPSFRRLTTGDFTVDEAVFSPDGTLIAISSRPDQSIVSWEHTDIHPFTRYYLQANPWDDPEIYAETSPITFIKGATTPTLIQHGEFDRRVPIPNAYELYQGLVDQDVETRLIVYKGFGHGITKPKERLAAVWHNRQWFAEHIWGESVELPED